MRRRWVATLGVAVAVYAIGKPAKAQCGMDAECKGARICDAGRCVEPPPGQAAALAPQPATSASAAPAAPTAPAAVASNRDTATPSPPTWQRRNPSLMILGIVATAAGGGVVLIGLSLSAMAAGPCHGGGCEGPSVVGFVVVGGILAGAGIPMLIVGGQKVPVGPRVALTPWASPASAGLKLRLEL
jgi:hypothetical protein